MKDSQEELIRHLSDFITPRRKKKFSDILGKRTRYITVVLEDIYQPQNASAVLRTCECFGIQDVHIIENRNPYTVNPDVALGADKWLNLIKYRGGDYNTRDAIRHLRQSGYRLVATTPGKEATQLEDFDLDRGKTALFFGTELSGLTGTVLEQSDELLRVPMYGFTGSYNISVSAAIILHHLTFRLHRSGIAWQLTKKERDVIMLEWLRKSVKHLGKSG